jgi:predicted alpha-1,2-mannosidase
MVQSMMNNDGENPRNCWNAYWENGYIPYFAGEHDVHVPKGQSVSTTLELAYDWWCIADFAERCGDFAASREAAKWANCWRNVFDAKTGFARPRAPRTSGGAWREPFDPRKSRVPGAFWSDYTEATPWVYTWHVFQDPHALADALGGRAKALEKLDEFFATPPPEGASKKNSDEGGRMRDGSLRAGQIGQYWHGNEPSHHIAYLYACWGHRAKTASLVGKICRAFYRPTPEGLCGNDDCGQMSAWYLFSMMGFYPVNPCGDGYVLGEAQAEEIELDLANGKVLKISRKNGNGKVFLDGKDFKDAKISHEAIMAGGELRF